MEKGKIIWEVRNRIMHGWVITKEGVGFHLLIERDDPTATHIELTMQGRVILVDDYEVQESEIRDLLFDEILAEANGPMLAEQEYEESVSCSKESAEKFFTHAYEQML